MPSGLFCQFIANIGAHSTTTTTNFMQRTHRPLLVMACLLLLFGCQNNTSEKTATTTASGDSTFQKTANDFITEYLNYSPAFAVSLGFHDYDGKVSDYSKASLDAQLSSLKAAEQRFASMDSASLSERNYYDLRILLSNIRSQIFSMEDMKIHTENPMSYAGALDLNIYIKRNFAPIEKRIRSIIAIEEHAPAIFAAAKANLKDSLAKPYVQLAIAIAKGSASFLGKDLMIALKDVKNDTLMASLQKSNKKAIDELNGFATWLEKEKLPKTNNNYALGEARYRKMLYTSEGITISPEKILEIGLSELKKEQAVFNAAAKIINPKKKPIDVYYEMEKEHPVADSLITDARKTIESIRQFVIDHKVVTVPSEVRAKVEETPAYARETSSASMDTPGPFEEKATEAYYYITPVDIKWTRKTEGRLAGLF